MKIVETYLVIDKSDSQQYIIFKNEDGTYFNMNIGGIVYGLSKEKAEELIKASAPPKLLIKKGSTFTIWHYNAIACEDIYSNSGKFKVVITKVRQKFKGISVGNYEIGDILTWAMQNYIKYCELQDAEFDDLPVQNGKHA